MKRKIKLIISLILLIIGIILIILAVLKNKDNNQSSNNKPGEDNTTQIIYNFPNFIIDNTNENEKKLSLDIQNNSENIIDEKKIYLNFYQKKDLIYTYEYSVPKLNPFDTITINVTLSFEYDYIDRYEFLVDGQKKEIEPFIINNNDM